MPAIRNHVKTVAAGPITEAESDALGLAWRPHAALLTIDRAGCRQTHFGTDLEYLELILAVKPVAGVADEELSIDAKFPLRMNGWPEALVDPDRPANDPAWRQEPGTE